MRNAMTAKKNREVKRILLVNRHLNYNFYCLQSTVKKRLHIQYSISRFPINCTNSKLDEWKIMYLLTPSWRTTKCINRDDFSMQGIITLNYTIWKEFCFNCHCYNGVNCPKNSWLGERWHSWPAESALNNYFSL